MDNQTRQCLAEVVEYLLEDEHKNWQEAGRPEGHIYNCIKKLEMYLADLEDEDGKITERTVLTVGDLVMNLESHTVTRGTKELKLNRKEFTLLEYLMHNAGITLTRQMILERVWDMNADPFTNTVDVHIRFLRRKIDDGFERKLIKTVHGFGYKLE